SKNVVPRVNICYFTKGGGKTLTRYDELKNKKIPKQRRDLIFKALCYLCYEIDINPMDIVSDLDVDFTRYYKTATPFV
ncbi:MAG: hypothetical protein RR192_04205, partial [Peptostreptococcaceae bacterium]